MNTQTLSFHSQSYTDYHFEFTQDDLSRLAPPETSIVVTDSNVRDAYEELLEPYRVVSFPAGEAQKNLDTLAQLTEELIAKGAHRKTRLIGFGGGVVTDMAGFLAATFMRGVPVGFVPTTLLAQVDAAIGGKNGVNSGLHKNMLGTFRQPDFIAFDPTFLNSLPDKEWGNGMAEVLKYGYIADTRILNITSAHDLKWIQKHPQMLSELIEGCVNIKNKIVHADEKEEGLRQVLNFGHTAGHAFETLYKLPHGHAIGLGMLVAMRLSEQFCGLSPDAATQLKSLLEKYQLPVRVEHNPEQVMEILCTDKKRGDKGICFVLLEKPGVAVMRWLKPEEIYGALEACV